MPSGELEPLLKVHGEVVLFAAMTGFCLKGREESKNMRPEKNFRIIP